MSSPTDTAERLRKAAWAMEADLDLTKTFVVGTAINAMREVANSIDEASPPVGAAGLSTPEPAPAHTTGPSIHDLVIEDMAKRKAFGHEKYGTILQAGNGRESIVDLYQELLDAVVYCRQHIEEQPARPVGGERAQIECETCGGTGAIDVDSGVVCPQTGTEEPPSQEPCPDCTTGEPTTPPTEDRNEPPPGYYLKEDLPSYAGSRGVYSGARGVGLLHAGGPATAIDACWAHRDAVRAPLLAHAAHDRETLAVLEEKYEAVGADLLEHVAGLDDAQSEPGDLLRAFVTQGEQTLRACATLKDAGIQYGCVDTMAEDAVAALRTAEGVAMDKATIEASCHPYDEEQREGASVREPQEETDRLIRKVKTYGGLAAFWRSKAMGLGATGGEWQGSPSQRSLGERYDPDAVTRLDAIAVAAFGEPTPLPQGATPGTTAPAIGQADFVRRSDNAYECVLPVTFRPARGEDLDDFEDIASGWLVAVLARAAAAQ